jgi:hypothetical protein
MGLQNTGVHSKDVLQEHTDLIRGLTVHDAESLHDGHDDPALIDGVKISFNRKINNSK